MFYEVAIEDFILMTTEDKNEAVMTAHEIASGKTSIQATEAWVNVFDQNGDYIETIY